MNSLQEKTVAEQCALIALLSYTEHAQTKEWFKSLGIEGVEYIDNLSIEGIMVKIAPKKVILAMRGTNDLEDWFINIGGLKSKSTKYGSIHGGFWDGACNVEKQVLAAAHKLVGRDVKLYLTGHSLGGALSSILALKLADQSFTIRELHLFGCPLTGARKFRHAVDEAVGEVSTWINYRDPVPKVPCPTWKHVGLHRRFKDGEPTIEESSLLNNDVTEHSMTEYLKIVRACDS
jgi:hypothetical protein